MKITIVGGGPAGLFFAVLAKKQDPAADVRVWERDSADNTYGWGVVFSGTTLSVLREADEPTHRALVSQLEQWDRVVVVHPRGTVTMGGNPFSAGPRLALLRVLQRRCAELGVEVCHGHSVDDPAELAPADLLVLADGRSSSCRRSLEVPLGTRLDLRPNRYIWLATPRLFSGLTLIFRHGQLGPFCAHAYRYCDDRSTFVVECSEQSFLSNDLGRMHQADLLTLLEKVFAEDLEGQPLQAGRLGWDRFVVVQNRRWSCGNTVLLGDALHTAHFSIGSGTKLAMESAVALARTVRESADIPTALAEFQRQREPAVLRFQRAADASMRWFETFESRLDRAPYPFALSCITRSGRIPIERIQRSDPLFFRQLVAQGAIELDDR